MAYLALARAGFRRWSSYRAAALAGVFTNTMFGFFNVAILTAAIAARGGDIGGYDEGDVVTFTWLTQGLIGVLAVWGWVDLAQRIQTGDIVTDLQRPVDVQTAYLAQDLGRAAFQLLARGLPPFLIGAFLFTVELPDDVAQWVAFALSVVAAVVVSFGIRFIVNVLAFWVLDFRGLQGLSQAFATIASGFVLPLAFFPPWAERVLVALPWASMVQIPVDVFLGKRTGGALASGLALQVFWAATLFAAGRVLLDRAMSRVVVQGG